MSRGPYGARLARIHLKHTRHMTTRLIAADPSGESRRISIKKTKHNTIWKNRREKKHENGCTCTRSETICPHFGLDFRWGNCTSLVLRRPVPEGSHTSWSQPITCNFCTYIYIYSIIHYYRIGVMRFVEVSFLFVRLYWYVEMRKGNGTNRWRWDRHSRKKTFKYSIQLIF